MIQDGGPRVSGWTKIVPGKAVRGVVHGGGGSDVRSRNPCGPREALGGVERAGDQDAEHEIYDDDAVVEYPQSGERVRGRHNVQALRSQHPARPSGFVVRRIVQAGVSSGSPSM